MAEQIVNAPSLYADGFHITMDGGNKLLTVGIGKCRDITNTFDMTLITPATVNGANNGVNGLDEGTLAASKIYAVFLISDPINGNPTGAILSLNHVRPFMPVNYSAYRKIGYAITDTGSANFDLTYYIGDGNFRKILLGAAREIFTAGSSTTYSYVSLEDHIPAVENVVINVIADIAPNAADDRLDFTVPNSTDSMGFVFGSVAGKRSSSYMSLLTRLSTGFPTIAYKVTNALDEATMTLLGFEYYV